MYAIRVIRRFYGPTTQKSYLQDPHGRDCAATFKTRAEAAAHVEMLDNEVYYTAHNESGRAEYKVVRVRND
jgi:hypothetical protein